MTGESKKRFPKAYKNFFFNLQKEIKVLDTLALSVFIICTEIQIVEKTVDSHL